MEFLGAVYYSNNLIKTDKAFVCRRYVHPQTGGSQNGFNLFQAETKWQFRKENSGSKSDHTNQLIGKAWKRLPADQRDDYNRKARERKPNKPMNERCPGRLRFKKVNGQALVSGDGLISYVPHSEELSAVMGEPIRLFNF